MASAALAGIAEDEAEDEEAEDLGPREARVRALAWGFSTSLPNKSAPVEVEGTVGRGASESA